MRTEFEEYPRIFERKRVGHRLLIELHENASNAVRDHLSPSNDCKMSLDILRLSSCL